MFRRFVSSLVLAAFLVAQAAAMPHAHGLEESHSGHHGSTPHVHFGHKAKGTRNGEHRSHSHGQSHHGEEEALDEAHDVEPLGDAVSRGHDDHDADAIYLPSLTTATGPRATHLAAYLVTPCQLSCFYTLPVADPPASNLAATHLRPKVQEPGCALYLALRTLRI